MDINPIQLQTGPDPAPATATQGGEQALTMDQMQNLTPDLFSSKGQKIVGGLLNDAKNVKPKLDNTFKMIAATNGLDPNNDFESRIKNSDTVVRKVALHRKEGKDGYRANDVNDLYGGRFIAKTPDQKRDIINAVRELDKGMIKIDKIEHVQHGTYNAHHIDFNTDGVKGELQIHDPHSLFESVMNHETRAKFGEHPPEPIASKKKAISKLGYLLPAQQAQQMAKAAEVIQQQKQGGGGI